MAHSRIARAKITHPNINFNRWDSVRTAYSRKMGLNGNLIEQAREIFKAEFNPENYILSHATIVASVDVSDVPNAKTGTSFEDGFKVERRYSDFRIKPECDKYINNNLDSFSRGVIKNSYRSFIGAQNYLEHVQIPSQSKGRVIDAVLRDIGDSLYVDILVATDKKHKDLIAAIQNGTMSAMSMGCTTQTTTCTKCGHVAADESTLCPHIKYSKGNTFYDEMGVRHRIAELCGHETEPESVKFIEASWVVNPAFKGAVKRNLIEVTTVSPELKRKAEDILNSLPPEWSADDRQKVAEFLPKNAFDWDDEGGEEGGDEGEKKEEEKKSPMEDVEDELTEYMLKRVKNKIKTQIKSDDDEGRTFSNADAPNENLNKWASAKEPYQKALKVIIKKAGSFPEMLDDIYHLNQEMGIKVPVDIYRVAAMAQQKKFKSDLSLHHFCEKKANRFLSEQEMGIVKTLLRYRKF